MAHHRQKGAFRLAGCFGGLLRFPQLALVELPIGDISNGAGYEETVVSFKRTQRNFGRKFGPIFAQSKQSESRPHRTGPGGVEKLRLVTLMLSSKSLRQ